MSVHILRDCDQLRFKFAGHGGYGLAVYPPGATFGPRTLGDFEFVWIVDGDVVWECEGVAHPAPAGTVLLARPGMRDGFRWDPKRPTRHGYVHFTLDQHGAQLPPMSQWPLTRLLDGNDIIRSLFRHLTWLLSSRGPNWDELAQGAMRQALVAFITGASDAAGEEPGAHSSLIDRMMAYVREEWTDGRLEPLSLAGLARAAGVTGAHLARHCRQALGATPMEALRLLRLDRAATLLARSNLSIQDIAWQCGFANPFHFSRAFRTVYNASPRTFRRKLAVGMSVPTIRLVQVRKLAVSMWRES